MTEETTTITPGVSAPWTTPGVSAPWTTSSATSIGRGATPDGDQTASTSSSFTDINGARTETTITNTSCPLANMIATTRKVTVIANGVATETVTATNTYAHADQNPVPVTISTRVYAIGAK
jgi:hypothetical protein